MQELFALQHGLPDMHTAWFEMRRTLCTMVGAVSSSSSSKAERHYCEPPFRNNSTGTQKSRKPTCTVVAEESTAISSDIISRHTKSQVPRGLHNHVLLTRPSAPLGSALSVVLYVVTGCFVQVCCTSLPLQMFPRSPGASYTGQLNRYQDTAW